MTSFKTFASALGILVSAALTFSASEESTRISVMSYNIENGGAQVDFDKTVEAIKKSGADVVGIQEAWGNTARLAKAVGWKYYDQRQHIISRFPLLEAPDSKGLYTFVEVLPGNGGHGKHASSGRTLWSGHGPIGFHGCPGGGK
jgi:hypothetical protein